MAARCATPSRAHAHASLRALLLLREAALCALALLILLHDGWAALVLASSRLFAPGAHTHRRDSSSAAPTTAQGLETADDNRDAASVPAPVSADAAVTAAACAASDGSPAAQAAAAELTAAATADALSAHPDARPPPVAASTAPDDVVTPESTPAAACAPVGDAAVPSAPSPPDSPSPPPPAGGDAPPVAACAASEEVATPEAPPAGGAPSPAAPPAAPPAGAPFAPPATARHASFLAAVDAAVRAAQQSRHARRADFCRAAAEAGASLFGGDGGGDSVVVARLRVAQAVALCNQSNEERKRGPGGCAEAEALRRRAWAALVAPGCLPALRRRADGATLLPGRCSPAEEAYYDFELRAAERAGAAQPEVGPGAGAGAGATPPPPGAPASACAPWVGYDTALQAAWAALNLLPLQPWRGEERACARGFVLATLRLVPATAGLAAAAPPAFAASEHALVDKVERYMAPAVYGADFCAQVLAAWASPGVAGPLRARGSLQRGVAAKQAREAEFGARQAADKARRGLRACALPSCGQRETTVLQFRVCGHCQRGVPYCCPEHAKQHWPAHKREEEGGAPGGGGGGGGGGGAA